MEGENNGKEIIDEKCEIASDGELWSAKEEALVRRRLDGRLLPLLAVGYLLCFIDRYVGG